MAKKGIALKKGKKLAGTKTLSAHGIGKNITLSAHGLGKNVTLRGVQTTRAGGPKA